ncbi:uncharacterized protein SCHCODRAFT_01128250 [Schizophyllum commune H4-8]|nr:uncharacterized protein SCHCODRAFT_01128250 [Schizophyllum commune H4-8]KAI5890006.1 hypothetical protein SCHCODRAFT_01128250 [Schizophyllum commune H4-8]
MYASSPLFMATSKTSSSVGTSGHGDEGFGLPQRRKTFSVRKTRLLNGDRMNRAFTTDDVQSYPSSSKTFYPEPTMKRQKSDLRSVGHALRNLLPIRRAASEAQTQQTTKPCTRSASDSRWQTRKQHTRKISLASLASTFLPSKDVSLPLRYSPETYEPESPPADRESPRIRLRSGSFFGRMSSGNTSRRRNRLSMLSNSTNSSGKKSDQDDSDSWRRSSFVVHDEDDDDDPFRPPTPSYLRDPASAPASIRGSSGCHVGASPRALVLHVSDLAHFPLYPVYEVGHKHLPNLPKYTEVGSGLSPTTPPMQPMLLSTFDLASPFVPRRPHLRARYHLPKPTIRGRTLSSEESMRSPAR